MYQSNKLLTLNLHNLHVTFIQLKNKRSLWQRGGEWVIEKAKE